MSSFIGKRCCNTALRFYWQWKLEATSVICCQSMPTSLDYPGVSHIHVQTKSPGLQIQITIKIFLIRRKALEIHIYTPICLILIAETFLDNYLTCLSFWIGGWALNFYFILGVEKRHLNRKLVISLISIFLGWHLCQHLCSPELIVKILVAAAVCLATYIFFSLSCSLVPVLLGKKACQVCKESWTILSFCIFFCVCFHMIVLDYFISYTHNVHKFHTFCFCLYHL